MKKDTYHKENLKEILIQEVIKEITSNGINSLSMRGLGEKCNVSRQAPYIYFENKEMMLKECADYVSNEFYNYLEDSIKGEDNRNPMILTKMGYAYVNFFKENPAYFDFIYNNNFYSITLTLDEVEGNFMPFELFRKVCLSLITTFGMSKEKGFHALVRCWSLVQGAASLVSSKNVIYNGDWDNALSELFDFKEE